MNQGRNPFEIRPDEHAGPWTPGPRLGCLYAAGVFFLPYIFAWFSLRKGTPTWVRLASFGWLTLFAFSALFGSDRHEGVRPTQLELEMERREVAASASIQALNLVREGQGLAAAQRAFPDARPEYAKETGSTYAADIYVSEYNSSVTFDAKGDTITNVSIQAVLFEGYDFWLEKVCRWANEDVRRYETPSEQGVEEIGCYTKTLMATCVPDLNACIVMFAPKGLPKSIPKKREIK
jgi:hypothetical protein